jgi:hypothetical protein
MVKSREDSSLVTKAAQDEIRIHAALDNLDGDAPLEGIVRALGQVDSPHPPAPYLALYPVGSEPLAYKIVGLVIQKIGQLLKAASLVERLVQKVSGAFILSEKLLDFAAQLVVAGAGACDIASALFRREV